MADMSAGRRQLFCLYAVVLLGAAAAVAQPAPGTQRHEWSPAVGGALTAYHAGDYAEAQRLCLHLSTDEPAARHDAAVIQALCLLRMPARPDRVDGRARLSQLGQEDPSLRDEPECNLAYGIAQTALDETPDALAALDRATAGFAAQKQPARELAALEALAQAWLRHNEWAATPPQFRISKPADSSAAETVRREQVAAVRARMEKLPGSAEAIEHLDLAVARHLLEAGQNTDEARAILTRLITPPRLTTAGAEAALLLAQNDEQSGQWAEALRLYERVQKAGPRELATQAEECVRTITRPQIEVDAPATVRCGQRVPLHLRVRGLPAVQLEVRRVDVDAWLAKSQSRGNEVLLPESGSVQLARDLDAHMADAYAWWQSDRLDPPLEWAPPAGAYVVLVKGRAADGHEHKLKRLVVASDLSAICFLGTEYALLWATGGAGEPTGKFWMTRSFTPVQPKFDGAVAQFHLPPEARVMQDKGWIALVRAGDHIALCRGQLALAQPAGDVPSVVLLAGPPTPQVGGKLYVSGLLLPASGTRATTKPGAPATVQLDVTDTADHVVFTRDLELSAGGALAAEFPIASELAGRHLRVLARQNRRTLENVAGRQIVAVPAPDADVFRVRCEVPPWVSPAGGVLSGFVQAEYAWGTRPRGSWVRCVLDAVRLPIAASNAEPAYLGALVREGPLAENGRLDFALSTGEFGVSGLPLAITAQASARSWQGLSSEARGETLLAPQQPYGWLTYIPAEPKVGQAMRFHVGWLAPGGGAVGQVPALEIRRQDKVAARLRLLPAGAGLDSETWPPAEPGSYDVAVTLPFYEGSPLELRRTVTVASPDAGIPAQAARPRATAHFAHDDGHLGVRVVLEGEHGSPLLVLLEQGQPLAAQALPSLAGRAELFLPLEDAPRPGMRVLVVGGAPEAKLLDTLEVAPDPQQIVELKLATATTQLEPGATAAVRATCRITAPAGSGELESRTTLTVRLVDATGGGHAKPDTVARRGPSSPVTALTIASSDTGPLTPGQPAEADTPGSGPPSMSESLRTALGYGATLWGTNLTVAAETTVLNVPIPATSGLYRLIAVARTPDGALATDALILDARRGVKLTVDLPAQLTLGDRSAVAVSLDSGNAHAVTAQVLLDPGAGLHVESARMVAEAGNTTPHAADAPVTVALPAGQRVWLYFDVEAARVGAGTVVVNVDAGGTHRSASCAYAVLPAAEIAGPGPGIRLKRTVFVWRARPEWFTRPDEDAHDQPYWESSAWSPTQRLVPGEFVQVREELVADAVLPDGTWSQRVPANCYATSGTPKGAPVIGQYIGEQAGALLYRVRQLAPGPHVHEYYLVVVRPGVCLLPAPELRTGDKKIPVTVDPPELRLIAVDGK